MTARRRLLATACAGIALVGLTGCEKPAPIVTVVSGGASVHKEADIFCFEGQQLVEDECAQRAEGVTSLEVTPGETVGVDVDRDIVQRGWFLELAQPGADQQEAQRSELFEDDHYFTFTAPAVGPQGVLLTVLAVGDQGEQGPPSGEWTFQLVAG